MIGDIAAFIRARLDEDEQIARELNARHPGPWRVDAESMPIYVEDLAEEGVAMVNGDKVARHIARHDAARVLRGVEAKRKLVETAQEAAFDVEAHPWRMEPDVFAESTSNAEVWATALKAVASEWSTHPDYRGEWSVGS